MKGREQKYKKLYSKSHEKILKVILQKYKYLLNRKQPKPADSEGSSFSSSDTESERQLQIKPKDYSNNPIKVNDEALERLKRAELIEKMMGNNYPDLAQQYISGEITLSQLKQHFYLLSKKIDYTCYDDLKQSLNLSSSPSSSKPRSRECHSSRRPSREASRRRPHSASWNFNTKIEKKYESNSITSEIFNQNSINDVKKEGKNWNTSIKVDVNLISDPSRRVCITNDRKERPKSSLKYGGKLSAKAMHDMMVESIFPYKRPPEIQKNRVSPGVKSAVQKASERIKNYSPYIHRRACSAMMKKTLTQNRATSEVRDIIYL